LIKVYTSTAVGCNRCLRHSL